jgi:hypothetical protein
MFGVVSRSDRTRGNTAPHVGFGGILLFDDVDAFDALVIAHLEFCKDGDCLWCGPDLFAVHDLGGVQ